LRIGHVGGGYAVAPACERGGNALQCIGVPSQQGQRCTFRGQGAGNLGADAARGTGDEGVAARQ